DRLPVRMGARARRGAGHAGGRDHLAMVVDDRHRDRRGGVVEDEMELDESLLEPHPDYLDASMRAIVVERPHDVALREVETPAPGPGEVRARSVRAGVCRTDLDIVGGVLDPRWVRFPVVPRHEWGGTVDAVGAGVTGFEPGQRVVCEGNIPCLACPRCNAGETQLCRNYDAVGFTRGGGYGEFVVVPARVVHRLPEHVSFDAAVLVEPGSVVLKGLERAQIQPGESVG